MVVTVVIIVVLLMVWRRRRMKGAVKTNTLTLSALMGLPTEWAGRPFKVGKDPRL